jgi:hypothetical protein
MCYTSHHWLRDLGGGSAPIAPTSRGQPGLQLERWAEIMSTDNNDDPRRPLLTAHAALVLLFSLHSGIGAAVLVVLAGRSGYEAALVGIGAAAVAIKFFHWLIQ